MNPAPLSPRARTGALKKLAGQHLDVLVIGGGVVGAGAALDAATRGLNVGLVEARDFASGTSSRSSKLIHGGLRYLEMMDFRLVAEALKERGLLMQRLAPHLVRPVPFLYPLNGRGWERWYAGSGVALYDAMSKASGYGDGMPLHRHLTRHGARKAFPSLRKDALVGAIRYYDAQVDDARHTMFLARTAATYGAAVASRTRVVGLIKESERVVGASVIDLETGQRFDVRASQVINATGVWTDETQGMARERGQFKVRASKGIHLVVPRDRIRGETGLILRTEKSVLFVIPWKRHWIIGTTDTDWELSKDHPAASSSDIDYLLEHVNGVLEVPLTRDDVEGVFAGLRPLLAGESEATSKLSREHAVAHSVPGLVVVAGGKYTTYRVMAADAVDEAVHGLETVLGRKVGDCVTENIPLVGADGYHALWNQRRTLAAQSGLAINRVEHLLERYGSLVLEVLQLIAAEPDLGQPLPGAEDYLQAEAVYAVTHEGARHLDDILTRRMRISFETFDRGVQAAPHVAELVRGYLQWDVDQTKRELEHYLKRVEAERESQRQPDDHTADAARKGAPDVVPVSRIAEELETLESP
ncbi:MULTISPECIES: glycerol-3-phosphate dehydrogenase/oxidase [unclassified Nocardioides]|uniref:glycerol-3-phosphate dehydrogenase/oxidase n=1 Tax=unclassified Nocardioides TaxID=2615069 RepID=UPI00070324F2|nr:MULTISPECIES: glycerol-3-phosphate dehydrogenase/oxidase [unclassified Nocardioides]KRC50120.1 glycerol-3-phosphate dehydrogenase [Nocardioides sp. Root79]KRC75587.1 glycerol-3-phosphate dehydrogenase [Nocardioides sp. Root240]